MSERWGDSRRDRDQLDRWITRDDDRDCENVPDEESEETELSAPAIPIHDVRILGPVLDTWREMYAEWEAGTLPSPSVSDLIYVAEETWQTSFPVGVATQLYEAQCDGVELPELLIHLYDMRQDTRKLSIRDIIFGVTDAEEQVRLLEDRECG